MTLIKNKALILKFKSAHIRYQDLAFSIYNIYTNNTNLIIFYNLLEINEL